MRPLRARPTPRCRLLYLITDLETGGVPLHLHRLVTSLDRAEFDALVVSLSPPGPVTRMLEADGVMTAACGAKSALDFAALLRLRRIIVEFRPNLVHSFLFHANVAARLVCPFAGLPARRLINEIQTVEIERKWHLVVDQLTQALCRVEIGNSESVVDHLEHWACIPREKLTCIRSGIDVRRITDAEPVPKRTLGVPRDAPMIVWVGRMDPVKRLCDLLDAFATVHVEPAAHLVLVGDGPVRGSVENRIERLKLRDRVHLLGFRDDVPGVLGAADMFVLPSLTEGMPNALLEAMAAGLPIIASDVPGCRDVVTHLRDGLLVPPASPTQLGTAMRELLTDAHLAERLGNAARNLIGREYAQEVTHLEYVELYRRCLG